MDKTKQNISVSKVKLYPYTLKLAIYLQRLMDNGFQGNILIPIKGKQFGLIKKEEFIDLRSNALPHD